MLINIIKENLINIRQILILAKADLVKFYKGAALGYLWAFIKPMVTIGVYLFAFQIGIRKGAPMDGFPFFLWLVSDCYRGFILVMLLLQERCLFVCTVSL